MENEIIAPLVKNKVGTTLQQESASGCCGGAPTGNVDACCQLDEQKKAEGEAGCGCNSSPAVTASACCQAG